MTRIPYEVCIDSVAGVIAAEAGGAQRVELCADLFEGGVTPSIGTIEAAVRSRGSVRIHVLIRPRGGDFIYSPLEAGIMERDIEAAREAGAQGIVIGAVTPEGEIDRPAVERLLAAARGLSTTFHRAFDMTADPFGALDVLIELGFDRLLTSGQEASALEGSALIADLVRHAGDRLIIMPGGGVNERTVHRILSETGCREFHATAFESEESPARHRNLRAGMGGALSQEEYRRRGTSASLVARMIAAAGAGGRA
jgi:copper homeostasis protein